MSTNQDLISLLMISRQEGNTTQLAEAARRSGGVLIVAYADEAKRLRCEDVRVLTLDQVEHGHARGLLGPFFVDNQAVLAALMRAAEDAHKLEAACADANAKVEALELQLEQMLVYICKQPFMQQPTPPPR